MRYPVKLLTRIDELMEADQGKSYREQLYKNLNAATNPVDEDKPFRQYLGASVIGGACPRAMWYAFRWTHKEKHPARLQRIFDDGQIKEHSFIALLRMAGVTVHDKREDGQQYGMTAVDGHMRGHLDGVVENVPDAPGAGLAEFKTHNDKLYGKLKVSGVKETYYKYYVQTQCYMGAYQLPWALYLGYNKNDSNIYGELIPYDSKCFAHSINLAQTIVYLPTPPARCSLDPTSFDCAYCDFKDVCNQTKPVLINCRTCQACEVQKIGVVCKVENIVKSYHEQLAGCNLYRRNPCI